MLFTSLLPKASGSSKPGDVQRPAIALECIGLAASARITPVCNQGRRVSIGFLQGTAGLEARANTLNGTRALEQGFRDG